MDKARAHAGLLRFRAAHWALSAIALSVPLAGCAARQHDSAPLRLMASTDQTYRARVADQIAVDALEKDALALRFRIRSGIMRERWGKDDVMTRESWAVPLGITVRNGRSHIAVATTRCVLDYRYPLDREMPQWSNLALFSSSGLVPNRQDIRRQVFRVGLPSVLPGVSDQYDPKRDALVFTSREYLAGPEGDRYFGSLKNGRIASAVAELPVGDWNGTSGVDLVVVHFPLSDPGLSAMVPNLNLGMREPTAALKAVLEARTSLWNDTFRFDLVSQECMQSARDDYRSTSADLARWRTIAIAAGVLLAVNYLGGFAAIDAALLDRIGRHATNYALSALWRSVEPLPGSTVQGTYWNSMGKLVLQLALSNGTVREYIVAGLSRMGLSPAAAQAILDALENLLRDPATRVATMERNNGPAVASVMVPQAGLDFAADLLARGLARLDPFDTDVLAQQPTLVQLARNAIADPSSRSELIQDEAYQRAVTNVALALGL